MIIFLINFIKKVKISNYLSYNLKFNKICWIEEINTLINPKNKIQTENQFISQSIILILYSTLQMFVHVHSVVQTPTVWPLITQQPVSAGPITRVIRTI